MPKHRFECGFWDWGKLGGFGTRRAIHEKYMCDFVQVMPIFGIVGSQLWHCCGESPAQILKSQPIKFTSVLCKTRSHAREESVDYFPNHMKLIKCTMNPNDLEQKM
jgi:hypothetical protein